MATVSTGAEWFAKIPRESIVVIAGATGIGKSQLAMSLACDICKVDPSERVLYVNGEQTLEQVSYQMERLGRPRDNLWISTEFSAARALERAERLSASVLIIDPIETLGIGEGVHLTRVADAAARIIEWSKGTSDRSGTGVTVFVTCGVGRSGVIHEVFMRVADVVITLPCPDRKLKRSIHDMRKIEILKDRNNSLTGWIDDPTREEMLSLIERCNYAALVPFADGEKAIAIGYRVPGTHSVFCIMGFWCPAEMAPLLADRSEWIGHSEFSNQLRSVIVSAEKALSWPVSSGAPRLRAKNF